MSGEYQTRWLAYARAAGVPPEQAKGYEYIIWIQQQWREWRTRTGFSATAGPAEHEAFDRWLWANVQPQTELLEVA